MTKHDHDSARPDSTRDTVDDRRRPGSYRHELAVTRRFIAQHFLTVPDPEPPEGEVHSHRFTLEVHFAGDDLGEYGYLLDINAVEAALDAIEDRYRDTLLNDLPEFGDDNPSVERFSGHCADRITDRIDTDIPERLEVRIWEDDDAWASTTRRL